MQHGVLYVYWNHMYLTPARTHMKGVLLSSLFRDLVERLGTIPEGWEVSGRARNGALSDSKTWTQDDQLGDHYNPLPRTSVPGRLNGCLNECCSAPIPRVSHIPLSPFTIFCLSDWWVPASVSTQTPGGCLDLHFAGSSIWKQLWC